MDNRISPLGYRWRYVAWSRMEKMAKLFFLFTVGLVSLPPAGVVAQDEIVPPVTLKFINFQSAKLISTGEPATIGIFRIRNNTNETIQIFHDAGSPRFMIQRFVKNKWQLCRWNWCGMGMRSRNLEPGKSVYFYINPEYYRKNFGKKLRFGAVIPQKFWRDDASIFDWSKSIDIPDIDNPDKLRHCRFIAPKLKDNDAKTDPNETKWYCAT